MMLRVGYSDHTEGIEASLGGRCTRGQVSLKNILLLIKICQDRIIKQVLQKKN